MKKKLEAELISIAHRILKLKNKSDLVQLHLEAQKLYEQLSVLRFVEERLGDIKPTISKAELEDRIAAAFEADAAQGEVEQTPDETAPSTEKIEEPKETEKPAEKEPETTEEPENTPIAPAEPEIAQTPPQPESEAEVAAAIKEPEVQPEFDTPAETAPEITKAADAPAETEAVFKPAFELAFEPKSEPVEEVKEDAKGEFKNANAQITFEDILGSTYVDPVFVKPEDLEKERETAKPDNVIPIGRNTTDAPVISINKGDEQRGYSLNDRLSKGITIGLNDRVAFMKHLFNNSSEDYNRVLSQLITFDTFAEAKSFIDNMVKPDYNNWEGKDEYAERFMEIVEKKFS